ncbi:MAG: Glycosyl transferase, family 2 [Ktedonobacterales bacterium]|nr:MAG: Glycosyl transferase, family 2 [Ktedonobacterales bacterium]
MSALDLSVVLPVYNEEANIARLHAEVKSALDALGMRYEIVYVDDGSKDRSYEKLAELAQGDPSVSVIRLRRNFGQTAAISAGIERAAGEIIVLMDADLQNDPRDIQRLLDKMNEGYDVVSGWRKRRKDKWLTRKLPSKMANGLISRVTGVRLHDYGCTLKAYRREVMESVRLYGEMHRFIPVYADWAGGRIAEIPVNHRKRVAGKSKYGLRRILRVPLDLITVKFLGTYSTKPLYMFGFVGMFLVLLAFVSEGVAITERFIPPYVHLNANPLTLLGAILVVLAVQVVMMGLLAELIMRTYYESQNKPTYIIRSVIVGNANGPHPVIELSPRPAGRRRYDIGYESDDPYLASLPHAVPAPVPHLERQPQGSPSEQILAASEPIPGIIPTVVPAATPADAQL